MLRYLGRVSNSLKNLHNFSAAPSIDALTRPYSRGNSKRLEDYDENKWIFLDKYCLGQAMTLTGEIGGRVSSSKDRYKVIKSSELPDDIRREMFELDDEESDILFMDLEEDEDFEDILERIREYENSGKLHKAKSASPGKKTKSEKSEKIDKKANQDSEISNEELMNMILENEDLEEVLPRLKKLLNNEKSYSENDATKSDDAKKEDFKK
uniref:Uncharacterized protein n=1 Tax=Acrobeloides nanus TaxID=290746 RepID=A0A914C2E8_9BILA